MSRALAALAALVALAPALAGAHGRSLSYSSWTLGPDGARVELRLAAIDLTLLGLDPWSDRDRIAAYATERLQLLAGDAPCTPAAAPEPREGREGQIVLAWEVRCPPAQPRAIVSRLLAAVAPSHLHFARVTGDGGAVTERVLTADAPRWELRATATSAAGTGASFVEYVRLGIDHIRTGWDHLAFVVALVLLAGSLGEVLTLVTSFTVAHSITLALATLGIVRPAPDAVEALIGFSIALVAVENGWLLGGRDRMTPWLATAAVGAGALVAPGAVGRMTLGALALFTGCHLGLLARSPRPERLRALVAFGFGLVHGFGFAGVLAELALPRARLVPALLGFNLGVEIGQILVVAVVWAVLLALDRRAAGARRRVAELGSAVIAGLGLFWFVTRAYH